MYSQYCSELEMIITRPGAVGSGPITGKHIYPFIPRPTIYLLKSAYRRASIYRLVGLLSLKVFAFPETFNWAGKRFTAGIFAYSSLAGSSLHNPDVIQQINLSLTAPGTYLPFLER